MIRTSHIAIMVLASVCTSVIVFLLGLMLTSGEKWSITASDAISIANTYIVFTTFLVTLFAIFVAVVNFYLSQNSAEMKMLKLQQEFEGHLASDDAFAKKMKDIAENHAKEQLKLLSQKGNILTDLVAQAVDAELQKQAKTNEGMRKFANAIGERSKEQP